MNPARLTPERLAEIRASIRTVVEWQRQRVDIMDGTNISVALLDELDAVTKERDEIGERCDELLEAANLAIAERDEAMRAMDGWKNAAEVWEQKCKSGSYSGMNLITNRERS